jgi:hypothetical protein
VAVYPPGATFGPRRLPDFEFVWLLQGTAEWRYEQGGSVTLRPSCLLLARPGMRDSFVWDRTKPTRHAYLHFRLAGELERLPDPALWPLVRTLPDGDPLRPLLRYLLDLGENRSRDHQRTVQEVLLLLLTLFVLGPLPEPGGEPLPRTSGRCSSTCATPGRRRRPRGRCRCGSWPPGPASPPAT